MKGGFPMTEMRKLMEASAMLFEGTIRDYESDDYTVYARQTPYGFSLFVKRADGEIVQHYSARDQQEVVDYSLGWTENPPVFVTDKPEEPSFAGDEGIVDEAEGTHEPTYTRFKLTRDQMHDAVASWDDGNGELSSLMIEKLCDYYCDEIPYGALTGDTATPDEWLNKKGYDVEAMDEIWDEVKALDGPSDQDLEDRQSRAPYPGTPRPYIDYPERGGFNVPESTEQGIISMKPYQESMKKFMDIASKLYEGDYEAEEEKDEEVVAEAEDDDLEGLEDEGTPDVNKAFTGLGRFDDVDQRDDFRLPDVGAHDASAETNEHELLFDIQDYQDRGISAAHKTFDVDKLRDMPIEIIQKIHQMVTGVEEEDPMDAELAPTESVAMEDGQSMSMPSAPAHRPGLADGRGLSREQMIQAIDEYQQLGVSSHPVKYDVTKLKSASIGTLADVYQKVTAKNDIDKVDFTPVPEMGESISEAVLRALKKMSMMNEEQRVAYTKSIKSKMLSESIAFVPMERINKPEVDTSEDDITRMRRLAGLIK